MRQSAPTRPALIRRGPLVPAEQAGFTQAVCDQRPELIVEVRNASAAAVLVTRSLAAGAARRVTTIGRLRAAGFRVVHSATKANRLHVSVYRPLTEAGEPAAWEGELAARFNACFT